MTLPDLVHDYSASLSLVGILAIGFGTVRRKLGTRSSADIWLGAMFGLVSMLQMNLPIEPMPGLIIDLRNIPLALCGAFLGWRASLIALLIAVGTRLSIGGVGVWSGMVAMTISVCAGHLWARLTRNAPKRHGVHFVLLALMMSTHLAAAMVLPHNVMVWFLSNAGLPLFGLNLLSISVVAMLIEAEMIRLSTMSRLKAAVNQNPDTGLLTREAFTRELAILRSSVGASAKVGLMNVSVRIDGGLDQLLSQSEKEFCTGVLRHRIKECLGETALVCENGPTSALVAFETGHTLDRQAAETSVRRAICQEPVQLPGGLNTRISIEVVHDVSIKAADNLGGIIEDLMRNKSKLKHSEKRFSGRLALDKSGVDALFAQADTLYSTPNGLRRAAQ